MLLIIRQTAIDDPYMRLAGYIGDLDYYAFLEQVEAQLEEDPQPVIDHLTALQAFLANRSGAVSGFAGNEASIALNRPLADAFFAKLPCVARDYPEYDLPVPAAPEEAWAWLADNGLMNANADLEADLTADFESALVRAGFEAELDVEDPAAVVTRGELAQTLMTLFEEAGGE